MTAAAPLYLAVMVLSGGAATALLRAAILDGDTDRARFHRALTQTLAVCLAALVALSTGRASPEPSAGILYAALNGLLGGGAFILFTKGLETTEASAARPALVVMTAVAVAVGILLLGESASAGKIGGALLAMAAVVLLSGDG